MRTARPSLLKIIAERPWFYFFIPKPTPRVEPTRRAGSAMHTRKSTAPGPRCWASLLISLRPRENSRTRTSCLFHCSPTPTRQSPGSSAYSRKRACMAGNTWGSSGPRSSLARKARSVASSRALNLTSTQAPCWNSWRRSRRSNGGCRSSPLECGTRQCYRLLPVIVKVITLSARITASCLPV